MHQRRCRPNESDVAALLGLGVGDYDVAEGDFRTANAALKALLAEGARSWRSVLEALAAEAVGAGERRSAVVGGPDGAPAAAIWVVPQGGTRVLAAVGALAGPGEAPETRALPSKAAPAGHRPEVPGLQDMGHVARLAGGIAHDFNNLLAAIRVTAHMLLRKEPDPDRRADCERIIDATERAARLTRGLLRFAGRERGRRGAVELRTLLERAAELLRAVVGARYRITLTLPDGACWTCGDPVHLEQAVTNLVLNATEAMPQGGRIHLELASRELPGGPAKSAWDAPPGRYHVVAVEDEGPGIPRDLRRHVFEPYFSTKRNDGVKGLGLGLATVYGVVQAMGGRVRVADGPQKGARIEMLLPAVEPSPEAVPRPPLEASHRTSRGCVLVVDDDALVRTTTARYLKVLGYEVLEASSGPRALALAADHRDRIDVVLLDMIMPGMNGRATARALRKVAPDVRVILMSGCSVPGEAEAALAEGAERFLCKPFDVADLAAIIAVGGGDSHSGR